MNKKELLEKYYEIAIIEENNKYVAICNNKENFDYEFFYVDNDFYSKVDSRTEKKLKKIYKFDDSPITPIKISNKFGDQKQSIKNKILQTATIITKYTADLPVDLQTKIADRITSLTFITDKEYESKHGKLEDSFIAAYHCKEHIIFSKEEYILSNRVLEHEMLHASSRNSYATSTGFQHIDIITKKILGRGLTESATDYFVYQISNRLPIDNMVQIFLDCFSGLVSNSDALKIKKFYFDADYYGLLRYLADFYHTDLQELINISLTFDALYNTITNELSEQKHKQILSETLYKHIASLHLNKLKKEKQSLEDYRVKSSILNKPENIKIRRNIDQFVDKQKFNLSVPEVILI